MNKESAREKFLTLVKANGWVLDPHSKKYSSRVREDLVQDPYAFVRLAADGAGRWRIKLDYSVKGSYWSSVGNLLQSVTLHYIPAGAELDEDGRVENPVYIDVLKNSDRSRWINTSYLWEALEGDDDKQRSIRQRAELLVKDPDLAAWLALEAKHQDEVRKQKEHEEWQRDREERERPLPITVEGMEWWDLTNALRKTAQRIHDADGKSDLPALLEELRKATAAVEAVVKVPVAQ